MKKYWSLRTRIFSLFFVILLLMVCIYVFVIHRFISRSTTEQLNSDYESILVETSDTMEKLLWNLTLTSQQLLESKDIQSALLNYTMARDSFSKQTSYSELLQTISMLTMSNSDLSLIYYYDEERQDVIYSTLPVSRQNDDLPILYESGNFCFRGPTRSQSNYVSSPVLMLDRSEVLADTLSVTLSMENG